MRRFSNHKSVDWTWAPDVKKKVERLVSGENYFWLKSSKIVCFRSYNSKTRATARIWGLSKIWQMALREEPKYIIEVIGERFDKLSLRDQNRVLIHELAHIPMNFSGALLPHRRRGKGSFYSKLRTMVDSFEKGKIGK